MLPLIFYLFVSVCPILYVNNAEAYQQIFSQIGVCVSEEKAHRY